MDLGAASIQDRADRRALIEGTLRSRPRKASNAGIRAACIDLARLDIVDRIAAPTRPSSPDDDDGGADRVPTTDELRSLAEALTREPWNEIMSDLVAAGCDLPRIGKELANHGWCDLIIGLVLMITSVKDALDAAEENAKAHIVQTVVASRLQGNRPNITRFVVSIAVGRVWKALKSVFVRPLLPITPTNLLRGLRMLAIFMCPAPEQHVEVREHALKPLGNDALGILGRYSKNQLSELFADWRTTEKPSTGATTPSPPATN